VRARPRQAGAAAGARALRERRRVIRMPEASPMIG